MSRIFTIFTNDTYIDPSKVIDAVINKDLRLVRLYTGSLNQVKDSQHNNLLHLATLNECSEIINYLLNNEVDRNYQNKFGLTPWDYALRSHNKEVIKIYTDRNSHNLEILKTKNETLQIANNNFTSENKKLVLEKDSHTNEIIILKKNNKRLRDENSTLELKINILTSDKEYLKNENDELVRANKRLKTSVDSLTQAMKK